MMNSFKHHYATCRVCKDRVSADELIKYGVRHYAHPECGLKRDGPAFFDCLKEWQLRNFPYMAAVRCGLSQELKRRVEALPPVDTTPIKL